MAFVRTTSQDIKRTIRKREWRRVSKLGRPMCSDEVNNMHRQGAHDCQANKEQQFLYFLPIWSNLSLHHRRTDTRACYACAHRTHLHRLWRRSDARSSRRGRLLRRLLRRLPIQADSCCLSHKVALFLIHGLYLWWRSLHGTFSCMRGWRHRHVAVAILARRIGVHP